MLTLMVASKGEWGAAVAAGKLHRAEMEWHSNAEIWLRDGQPIAGKRRTPMGVRYYLGNTEPPAFVRVQAWR
jgi:hypothetical protein